MINEFTSKKKRKNQNRRVFFPTMELHDLSNGVLFNIPTNETVFLDKNQLLRLAEVCLSAANKL